MGEREHNQVDHESFILYLNFTLTFIFSSDSSASFCIWTYDFFYTKVKIFRCCIMVDKLSNVHALPWLTQEAHWYIPL